MLQGEALYQALEPSHPLLTRLPIGGPVCFETFPHAITWRRSPASIASMPPSARSRPATGLIVVPKGSSA